MRLNLPYYNPSTQKFTINKVARISTSPAIFTLLNKKINGYWQNSILIFYKY